MIEPSPERKSTILVVDDTPANLALLSETLKSEYRIKVASSGERALTLAATDPPDLILLDVMMPGMSGHAVCQTLKSQHRTSTIPIIFITSMGDVEDEKRGLALGAVDYITKPINPPIVQARVRTHLQLHEQSRRLKEMVVTLEQQATQLREWTTTLEERVARGIAENDKLVRLKRFFSPAVADLILSGSADDYRQNRRREITVLFLDIRGYTAFTETADPEDVMQVLSEFHDAMGRVITAYGATLERFAGDSIMAFFNDPVPIPDPALRACQMAIEMQRRLHQLTEHWRKRGFDIAVAIGIAQGYATVGMIGFEHRRDYGAIGTVTNLASRLCSEGQSGQILISQRVCTQVEHQLPTRDVGLLHLKGFQRPTPAYELLLDPPAA
ncbi:MAG: Adenylate cyclase 2 [Pseudomonadota bacterium]|jgi:class 3 adenylate cyclase/CheY-like chemotaxis protein